MILFMWCSVIIVRSYEVLHNKNESEHPINRLSETSLKSLIHVKNWKGVVTERIIYYT
jgi:hypothetical protein